MRLSLSFTTGLIGLGLIACQGLTTTNPAKPTVAGNAPSPADEIKAALPVIPDAKFNLTDFGGVGDGKTLNTDAFKKAVDAIAKAGGGHLIVPAGMFKTLQFQLTSKMDLHLDAGATIKFPENVTEYGIPDPNKPSAGGGGDFRRRPAPLIGAPRDATDIAITGSGTIDGSGQMFWIWSDKAARRYPEGRTVLGRPGLIAMNGVKRMHVDGVTISNSPMFQLAPRGEDITIENIRVFAPSDAPNTDSINIGGQRLVVRNCEIDSGDDNVAVQSGSHDVLIENLTCLHGHGISIGSPTRNGLSHIFVRNCTFDGTDNGLRIKSYRGNGGEVHDIHYSNITMKNVRRPFDINALYNGNANTPTDVGPREAKGITQNLPNFHDIHITNLTVTRSPLAGRILGLPEQMVHDITFKHVKFQTDRGFLVQDAKAITFEDSEIISAVGEPLVLDNATVKLNGTEKTGTSGGPPTPFYPGN